MELKLAPVLSLSLKLSNNTLFGSFGKIANLVKFQWWSGKGRRAYKYIAQ